MSLSGRGGKRKGAGRPKEQNPKQPLLLRLEPQVIEYIDSLAKEMGLSRSEVITKIIQDYKKS